MVCFISIHNQIRFEMQRNSYRYRDNSMKVSSLMILLLGAFIAFGLLTNIVTEIFWPFPTVGIIITILIIYLFSRSRSKRRKQEIIPKESLQKDPINQYKEISLWKNQEKDFIPSRKYKQKIINESRFCDYCGIILENNISYCTNCGNKLK